MPDLLQTARGKTSGRGVYLRGLRADPTHALSETKKAHEEVSWRRAELSIALDELKLCLSATLPSAPVRLWVGDVRFELEAGELGKALGAKDPDTSEVMQVTAAGGLRVRNTPSISGSVRGVVADKSVLIVAGNKSSDGHMWAEIQESPDAKFRGGWVSRTYLKPSKLPLPVPIPPMNPVRSVGFHISIGKAPELSLFADLHKAGRPVPLVMLVNQPLLARQIKQASPNTVVAMRWYPDDQPTLDDPGGWFGRQLDQLQDIEGVDYLTLTNEWCANENQTAQQAQREAHWWQTVIELAKSAGVKITVLDLAAMHLARPHVRPDLWGIWKPILEKAARYGFPLNYHAYTHPTAPYNMRYEAKEVVARWIYWVREIPNLKILCGEWGAGNWNTQINHHDIAMFMGMIREWDKIVEESGLRNNLIGAAAFTLGATEDWKRFDFSASLPDYVRYMKG